MNLVASAAYEFCLLAADYRSTAYAVVFCIGAAAIWGAAVPLAYSALPTMPPSGRRGLRGFVGVAAFALAALLFYCDVHRSGLQMSDWIGAANGAGDAFLAAFPMFGAAYVAGVQRRLALSLFAMWMAQAYYEFGWTLHWTAHEWQQLNEWLPSLIVASGCLWLGLFCNPKRVVERA